MTDYIPPRSELLEIIEIQEKQNKELTARIAELEKELSQKGGDASCRTIHCAATPVIDTGGPAEGHPVPNVRSNAPIDVQSVSQGQKLQLSDRDAITIYGVIECYKERETLRAALARAAEGKEKTK